MTVIIRAIAAGDRPSAASPNPVAVLLPQPLFEGGPVVNELVDVAILSSRLALE